MQVNIDFQQFQQILGIPYSDQACSRIMINPKHFTLPTGSVFKVPVVHQLRKAALASRYCRLKIFLKIINCSIIASIFRKRQGADSQSETDSDETDVNSNEDEDNNSDEDEDNYSTKSSGTDVASDVTDLSNGSNQVTNKEAERTIVTRYSSFKLCLNLIMVSIITYKYY
jgi:hypothetical protein